MKKLFICMVLLMGMTFAQSTYSGAGSFYKDFLFSASNTYSLVGQLPPRGMVTSVRAALVATNSTATITNVVFVGLVGSTNYFITTGLLINAGLGQPATVTTTGSNFFMIVSSNNPTPVFARFTNSPGAMGTGNIRVIVDYIAR